MQPDPVAEICVVRIEHPRGDGLGRALVLDCHGGSLTLLFDDPAQLCALIEQLSQGLAWMTERSRDLPGRAVEAPPVDPDPASPPVPASA
jgi:hypothetical protein